MVGVRSTARLFGSQVGVAVAIFSAVSIVLLAAGLAAASAGWLAYFGLLLGAGHLAWQAMSAKGADAPRALGLFRSNRTYGLILFVFLAADAVVTAA